MVDSVDQVVSWAGNIQREFRDIGFESGEALFGGLVDQGRGLALKKGYGPGTYHVLVGASGSVKEVRLVAMNSLTGSTVAMSRAGQGNHPNLSFQGPGTFNLEAVSQRGSGFVSILVMKENGKYQIPVKRVDGSFVNTMKSANSVRTLASERGQKLYFPRNEIRMVGGVVEPSGAMGFGNMAFNGRSSWFLAGGDRYAQDVDLLLFPNNARPGDLAIAKDLRAPNYASVFLPRPRGKIYFEARATRTNGPTFISAFIMDQR